MGTVLPFVCWRPSCSGWGDTPLSLPKSSSCAGTLPAEWSQPLPKPSPASDLVPEHPTLPPVPRAPRCSQPLLRPKSGSAQMARGNPVVHTCRGSACLLVAKSSRGGRQQVCGRPQRLAAVPSVRPGAEGSLARGTAGPQSSISQVLPSPPTSQVWRLLPAPLHTHFLMGLFTLPVCLLSSQ